MCNLPAKNIKRDIMSYVLCCRLAYGTPGTTYTCIQLSEDPTQVTASFSCTLKFMVKDCDPASGEPDDDDEGKKNSEAENSR